MVSMCAHAQHALMTQEIIICVCIGSCGVFIHTNLNWLHKQDRVIMTWN